ncbi:hypothetical protein JY651_07885 [Pyxidicoccus parkwayensis]|uniref:Nuclease associated modular domain-containing protein n=1 Tax=Pyxidicoccus parkwayensis TaxID=2813578 RepID=A0ABX7P303_9BACT|nr:hypothetical protein [Pyxidicoccus parkwaysis]QSQ24850.1 hypothetical protein JY651_07885 [Pyxidicoccus parkwaysis]
MLDEGATSTAELNEAECFHIAYYRSIGCRLVNSTDGGEGAPGFSPTPETREKMRTAALRPGNLEKLRRMAEGNRGKSITEAHRARVRDANLGKVFSEEHRAKLRAAHQKPERKEILRRTINGPKPSARKPVMDERGVIYESISAAAASHGLTASQVSGVLYGRHRHAGGHTFTWALQLGTMGAT